MLEGMPDDDRFAEAVRRIAGALKPDRIYLFGSQARGDANEHSDFDLLVVVPESSEPNFRLSQRAHSLLWGLGISVDVVVVTRDFFERRLHVLASLPATVAREGQLLYAA